VLYLLSQDEDVAAVCAVHERLLLQRRKLQLVFLDVCRLGLCKVLCLNLEAQAKLVVQVQVVTKFPCLLAIVNFRLLSFAFFCFLLLSFAT
jgi:hypothetical protein